MITQDFLLTATVSARVTSPLEGIIGVKFVHWFVVLRHSILKVSNRILCTGLAG